jgi:hypothetical protein
MQLFSTKIQLTADGEADFSEPVVKRAPHTYSLHILSCNRVKRPQRTHTARWRS